MIYSAKSLTLLGLTEVKKFNRLFVAGAHFQLLVAKTASTMSVYLFSKCWDAILGKLNNNMFFDLFMELCSAPLPSSLELFPRESEYGR